MKKILTVLIVSLISGIAAADLAVDLKNNAGLVLETDGTTYVDQALVQLIWSPTDSAQAVDTGNHLASGEYLLNTLTTTSGAAGTWGDQLQGVLEYDDGVVGGTAAEDTIILSGYIFVRIFDNTATELGDWYLQQYVQGPGLTRFNATATETIYQTAGTLGGALNDASFGQQVIPEPAVAALLGIFGGGLLVARRLFSGQS